MDARCRSTAVLRSPFAELIQQTSVHKFPLISIGSFVVPGTIWAPRRSESAFIFICKIWLGTTNPGTMGTISYFLTS
ncbi:MAG: hypothetical protein HDT35_03570 [Clostridiales bacterium]|nr:hypothetical protein [Clostridiales bacterium]